MHANFEQLIIGMAKAIEDGPKGNNFRFCNEEDALHHASRVAQLKPGSFVTFRNSEGLHNAVFLKFDDKGRAELLWYDPEDGGYFRSCIVASGIIFDYMPAERAAEFPTLELEAAARENAAACENCEDDEWDGAGPADEFPRT